MGEAQHTPTPWVVVPQSDGSSMIAREYETGRQMNPKGLRLVAHALARGNSLPEDEANAAFIVHAVNSHATLTAALEEARGALEKIVPTVPEGCALKRGLPVSALYKRKAARDSCYVTIADFDRARAAIATIKDAVAK